MIPWRVWTVQGFIEWDPHKSKVDAMHSRRLYTLQGCVAWAVH